MVPSAGVGGNIIVGAPFIGGVIPCVPFNLGTIGCSSNLTFDGGAFLNSAQPAINVGFEFRMVDALGKFPLYGCNHSVPTDRCYASDTAGDLANRFTIDVNGTFSWGPGNTTLDTQLLRFNPGTMVLQDINGLTTETTLMIGTTGGLQAPGYGSLSINGSSGSLFELMSGGTEIVRWQALSSSVLIVQTAAATGGIEWLNSSSMPQALYYPSTGVYFGNTPVDPGANNVTVEGRLKAASYSVGATAGTSCTLTTVSHLTVVNGIVTQCD